MIVDASALLAIVFDEPEGPEFVETIVDSKGARMSTVNWFEATMALDRDGDDVARRRFDELFEALKIELLPFNEAHAAAARVAWSRFGRRAHRARLNFGDCMAYGVTRHEGEALLFKGNDFPETDIATARRPTP